MNMTKSTTTTTTWDAGEIKLVHHTGEGYIRFIDGNIGWRQMQPDTLRDLSQACLEAATALETEIKNG